MLIFQRRGRSGKRRQTKKTLLEEAISKRLKNQQAHLL